MTPLWTLGSLHVTPYSLMILLGALAGVALSLRKKEIRPLLPAVILGALIVGHAAWVLFCPYDLEAYEGKLFMLLRPWDGGYTLYGALLGGALGALIAGKLSGVRWLDALDALAPGACASIFFARIGEVFTGEGIGRITEVDWTHFFPLSVCAYQDEYFEEWRYIVWFWEALAALILLIVLLKNEKKAFPGRQTAVFLMVLGTTQILLEQMRRDHYLRLIVFVRVNQLAALATLIIVLVALLIRRKPGKTKVIWCLVTLVLASLADMASEFVFDKYEYAPWLYLSMPLAVLACSAMLWTWKKQKGLLPAVLLCVVTAALLIGYASRNWDEIELEPVDDLVRFAILYATMVVDLVCIGLTIHLNLQPKKE
ncbi:prolipoprotein diacylglyceryl transferase family protein [Aristaeella lactis]|uniref:Prolipoprotein diacylglyceryltransferase n=1 Tax=Aristaeella lactis TaxID=3046383 RepID=A0AC61PMR8_9FIRM|nr:prolipoprotein diacylglyceryl transferase family protein [Aristaeella lactis]QUA52684.1 prolipoprotein diacylglyceryl transferase [Aristaeella lactis]SMC71677.1 Prolipoprotein diacylglyceryltransferase [Aristaeella lactis]